MPYAHSCVHYESIEEAIYTRCHLCGTPLDWSLKLVYNEVLEKNFIFGTAKSCGIEFSIEPNIDAHGNHDGYMLFHSG